MRAFKQMPLEMSNDGVIKIELDELSTTVFSDLGNKIVKTIIQDKLLPGILKKDKDKILGDKEKITFKTGDTLAHKTFMGALVKFHGTYYAYHKNMMFLVGSYNDDGFVSRDTNEVIGVVESGGSLEVKIEYDKRDMYTTARYVTENVISESTIVSLLPPPTHTAIKDMLRRLYGENYELEKTKDGMEIFSKNNELIKGKPLTYRIDPDGIQVFDYKGETVTLEMKIYKYLEAIVKQIVKIHTEMETYYISETFLFGDWVAGTVSNEELPKGR